MKNIKFKCLLFLVGIFFLKQVDSQTYEYKFNPYTRKLDMVNTTVGSSFNSSLFMGKDSTHYNDQRDYYLSLKAPLESPVFTGVVTSPEIIGGVLTNDSLIFKGTACNGTSTVGAINFLVGNNGATNALSITNSGYVGIGAKAGSTYNSSFPLFITNSTNNLFEGRCTAASSTANYTGANFYLTEFDGDAMGNSHVLGSLLFRGGVSGIAIGIGSGVRAFTTQTWSGGCQGSKLTFLTVPNNSTVQRESLTMDHSGNVGIKTTGSVTANFQVAQEYSGVGTVTITGNTTCTGTYTQFLNTFKVGDSIRITATGEKRVIVSIASNYIMTIASATNTTSSAYTLDSGIRFSVMGNGNIGVGTTSPSNIFSISGQSAQKIWCERNTTANTAGLGLTISSGGTTSGATNKGGIGLILQPDYTTGVRGTTKIELDRQTRNSANTTDNTFIPHLVIPSTKPLTDAANDTIYSVVLNSDSAYVATISLGLTCNNGTDRQARAGFYQIASSVKAGVITSYKFEVNATPSEHLTGGSTLSETLSLSWNNTTKVLYVIVNYDSSLNPTAGQMNLSFTILQQMGTNSTITQY